MTITRAVTVTALLVAALCAPGAARAQDAPKPPERTPEERRAAAEDLFGRLDKNRDLELKGDELPNEGWLARYDRDADDAVSKREMLEIVDRGPGYDRLFVLRDTRARAVNARNQFDQDKDGFVSKDEYPGDEKVFKKFDRNRDEKLEWKELVRLASDELDEIRKKCRSPGRYDLLPLFDLNYDRQVVRAEYDGPDRVFRKYDENGDDVVDYYEIYPDRRPEAMERKAPEPEDLNAISTLDKDEDGKISREEWKGSEAAWKRLDRNGDGWITTADAR